MATNGVVRFSVRSSVWATHFFVLQKNDAAEQKREVGEIMSKQVCFTENGNELTMQIEAFRKAQVLPSFIEAVRALCKNGLRIC